MSKKAQTDKNIDLSGKLMKYLAGGKKAVNWPNNVAFVPFSKSDRQLNNANERLLESLSAGKDPVARAYEPKSSSAPWTITPVNF